MGYTDASLPFASGSHTSYRGALKAAATRAEKTRRYLSALTSRGPLTDWEAAHAVGCERTSINSIRANLITAGLVTKGFATRPGPDGETPNATWELTEAGRKAVEAMKESRRR